MSKNGGIVTTHMPDTTPFENSQYSPDDIDLFFSLWKMSEFAFPPPHPEEVFAYPAGYIELLMAYYQGVKFHEDQGDREVWG